MKRLFLLRHAQAGPGESDVDRPLTDRGRADALWLGGYLKDKALLPDVVLCAAAVRARETCDLVQKGAETTLPVTLRDDLYLASPQKLARLVAGLDSTISSAMIIGHNPGLEQFCRALLPGSRHGSPERKPQDLTFPTGCLTVIDFDLTDWTALDRHPGRLFDRIIPADRRFKP